MDPAQLNPGDKVISLAALTITTTIITGSVNAAVITWKFNQTWWLSVAAFLAVILIWVLAKLIGSMIFNIQDTYIIVVKAGESALQSTLKAAFIGATIALFIFGFAYAYILGGPQLFMSTWPLITLISFIVGETWGTLAALL